MNRRTVLKGGLVLATTSHTAIANAEVAETPHAKLKRLAWEISDLLNGLEPRFEYLTIRPSNMGRSAVYFGFDIDHMQEAKDPLLETIRAYEHGLADWIKNSPDDNDGAMAYSDVTYGPPLARLHQWDQPATTREGAIAALKLAVDDDNGVRGMEAEDRMVKAVLGYLEGLR